MMNGDYEDPESDALDTNNVAWVPRKDVWVSVCGSWRMRMRQMVLF